MTSIFQFDRRLTQTLDILRQGKSRGATIRRAIALFAIVVKARRDGFKLYTVASDGTRREIILP